MNPKLVYQIKTMPLTLNGKIDKDKLLTIKRMIMAKKIYLK